MESGLADIGNSRHRKDAREHPLEGHPDNVPLVER